ncbi:Cation/H(+) antiporter 17 [Vitis vinifera]|uniref:Cation/H(+) antiporter 17 n=1 Tax=Vitis vinifera TaxID=29760 RepID=A0A438HSP6_VITVI|nr:Cation/H(+) antiporter 17 [Vitis vinifera]
MECLHIFLSSGLAKTGSLADHKTTMAFNMTSIKTSSDGAWQGDNPLRVEFCSDFSSGPKQRFLALVFPPWSTPILESVASVGLLFFLFLVGLELDLSSIRRSGKRAFGIALAGISLPFIFGVGITFLLRKLLMERTKTQATNNRRGQTAMAAAAFNDVAAWILLAPAVALAGNGGSHSSPLASIWILISGVAFVAFMLTIIRPAMNWVGRQCSRKHDSMDEAYICLTLAGVMLSGLASAALLRFKRIEDGRGENTGSEGVGAVGVGDIDGVRGKVLGTFVVAMLCMTPVRESLVLGVLMNTKGLVELIVLNIGKEKKVTSPPYLSFIFAPLLSFNLLLLSAIL